MNLKVFRDKIEFEAAQCREIATGEGNSIDAIDREGLAKKVHLMGEEADIETDVMSNDNGALNKAQEVGKDLLPTGGFRDHFLRDTGELDDEGWQTTIGVDETLEGVDDLTATQADSCHFDDAIWSGTQAGGFGIEHDKIDLIQEQVRATPGRE